MTTQYDYQRQVWTRNGDVLPCAHPATMGPRCCAAFMLTGQREQLPESAGHIGWTWTIEAGIVEVLQVGESIVRAPVSNVMVNGQRLGREWWPAAARFDAMWRPLTFATVAAAVADLQAAGA